MSVRNLFIVTLFIATLGAAGNAAAQNVSITLGDKSARFGYGSYVGGSTYGRTELNGSLLYNTDDNRYLDLGLLVVDNAGSKNPGLEVGLGPKLMFFWHGDLNKQGLAIALGGRLNFKPMRFKRLRLGFSAFYAPMITSFIDVRDAYELDMRVGYEILPTASAYLGWRRINADFNKGRGRNDIDRSGYLGMVFSF